MLLLSPSLPSSPPTIPSHTQALKALSFIMLRGSRTEEDSSSSSSWGSAPTSLKRSRPCWEKKSGSESRHPPHAGSDQMPTCANILPWQEPRADTWTKNTLFIPLLHLSSQLSLTCRLPESASLVVLTPDRFLASKHTEFYLAPISSGTRYHKILLQLFTLSARFCFTKSH